VLESMCKGHIITIAIVPMVTGSGARIPFRQGEGIKVFTFMLSLCNLIT
jgi:hypothetical protein